jgi:hypothetical protein
MLRHHLLAGIVSAIGIAAFSTGATACDDDDCDCRGLYAPQAAYSYAPPVYYVQPPAYAYAPRVYYSSPPSVYVPAPAYGYYAAPAPYAAYGYRQRAYDGYYAGWRRW